MKISAEAETAKPSAIPAIITNFLLFMSAGLEGFTLSWSDVNPAERVFVLVVPLDGVPLRMFVS
jgi:hypothetical protein